MKRKQLLAANIIGIVLVVFIIIAVKISYSSLISGLSKSISDSQAIGIIGGADGPTAIFISGGFDLNTLMKLLLLLSLLLVVLLLSNVVYLKKLGKS